MATQLQNRGFTLKSAIGALTDSVASFWKPMLIAAPLIGTAFFFASGTNAQTSGGTPSPAPAANGTVAPIASPDAARRKGPKSKRKDAISHRVANPTPTGELTADAPVAPIASPEAARTGRPKEKEKEATNDSVASPPATTEPVAQPTERRRRGPKVRDDDLHDTSRTRSPSATTPKRGTSLMLPALGGAAAIAAIIVAASGNDRPTSP